ncbi:MAG: SirB2 family protein [Cocleimonas sp.]|nr:SirB2 family protein [Cocleimonas sp.]
MNHPLLTTHLVIVGLSLLLYLIRGGLMLAGKSSTVMTSLAAVISMGLFGTGISMVFMSSDVSFANSWVIAMMISFLLYVTFGVIALKSGLRKPVAIILWLLGLASFAFALLLAMDTDFAQQLLGGAA